jgi:hypothetical protein
MHIALAHRWLGFPRGEAQRALAHADSPNKSPFLGRSSGAEVGARAFCPVPGLCSSAPSVRPSLLPPAHRLTDKRPVSEGSEGAAWHGKVSEPIRRSNHPPKPN